MTSEASLAGVSKTRLKMKQPQRGATVQNLAKQWLVKGRFATAKRYAETLDSQSAHILKMSSLSRFERWRQNVDLESTQKQYTQNMMAYLDVMTELFRVRRQAGGFSKLREFDFQNMIRKGDYLLMIPMTKVSLEENLRDEKMAGLMKQTVLRYNQERQLFDRKIFTIAKN